MNRNTQFAALLALAFVPSLSATASAQKINQLEKCVHTAFATRSLVDRGPDDVGKVIGTIKESCDQILRITDGWTKVLVHEDKDDIEGKIKVLRERAKTSQRTVDTWRQKLAQDTRSIRRQTCSNLDSLKKAWEELSKVIASAKKMLVDARQKAIRARGSVVKKDRSIHRDIMSATRKRDKMFETLMDGYEKLESAKRKVTDLEKKAEDARKNWHNLVGKDEANSRREKDLFDKMIDTFSVAHKARESLLAIDKRVEGLDDEYDKLAAELKKLHDQQKTFHKSSSANEAFEVFHVATKDLQGFLKFYQGR